MFPQISDCSYIGKISRPHGPEGYVLVHIFDVTPDFFNEIEYVFLEIQQKLVPFFIQNCNIKGNNIYIQFDDILNVPQAEKICGLSMFFPKETIEVNEEEHELIGCELYDGEMFVGKVIDIIEYPMHAVFEVETPENKELLVPFAEDLIQEIILQERKIIMNLPNGLLE